MVEKEKEILDANFVDGKSSGCESTKATILRAALEEFALKSVDGARTREIASKANVNHAAINYYFGGKMEMYTEILRASVEHFNEEYAKFLSDSEIFIKSGKSDKKEAISIIKEAFLRSHKNLTSATFFYFMLLVKREETFPTSNFEITFEGSFKLFLTRLVGLIRAIKKELGEEEAIMIAFSIVGLNESLSSCKTAFLRMTCKSKFDESDIFLFDKIISEAIEKILS